jgi:hypothetical protein
VGVVKRFVLLAVIASASAVGGAEYPLIVFRLTDSPVRSPEFFKASCEVHAKYKGAFDEFWYGGGQPLCKIEVCREDLKKMAALRPWVEKAGMRLSFQQGLTTGHDYAYVGKPGKQAAAGVYASEEAEPFPDDAWMVRKNGEQATGRCLCPRSPAVLDYESRFVKATLEELHPVTYWLDDDLRLGVGKVGCFCPRCLAAFNRKAGTALTRDALVKRLFEGAELDPLRLEWITFNEESLALYGRAARKAADEVMPACRLALQTVSADCLLNGRDYAPILRELSANGRVPAGLRPGHGCYREDRPLDFLEKALWCTREAERSRRLGNLCGTVCYEEETYTRRVLHKSPNAIVTEAALALASGCDTVSFYWADGEKPERIEDYERFVKAIARARGYFERLSASTRRTSLGGVARYLGSKAFEQDGFSLGDPADLMLARCGIPVTVAESASKHKVWYASDRSRKAMTEADFAKAKAEGLFEFVPETHPLVSTRQRWLDEIDRASGGRFPVRIDLPHALRVLPRIDAAGKTDSVTLLNLSIGDADVFTVKIRNPRRLKPVLASPQRLDVTLECVHDASRDELQVVVPDLAGWQICTIFL